MNQKDAGTPEETRMRSTAIPSAPSGMPADFHADASRARGATTPRPPLDILLLYAPADRESAARLAGALAAAGAMAGLATFGGSDPLDRVHSVLIRQDLAARAVALQTPAFVAMFARIARLIGNAEPAKRPPGIRQDVFMVRWGTRRSSAAAAVTALDLSGLSPAAAARKLLHSIDLDPGRRGSRRPRSSARHPQPDPASCPRCGAPRISGGAALVALQGPMVSPHRLITYRRGADAFDEFCRRTGERPLPASPDDVIRFLRKRIHDGLKVGALSAIVSGICYRHELAGWPSPTRDRRVVAVISEQRKIDQNKPRERKLPLTRGPLKRVVEATPDTIVGLRDRAMMLVGYAGALRPHQIVRMRAEDLKTRGKDFVVRIGTDSEQLIADEQLGAASALRRWLDAAEIEGGPIFRRFRVGRVIAQRLGTAGMRGVLKLCFKRAGLDATGYSASSLRLGRIADAQRAAKSLGRSREFRICM